MTRYVVKNCSDWLRPNPKWPSKSGREDPPMTPHEVIDCTGTGEDVEEPIGGSPDNLIKMSGTGHGGTDVATAPVPPLLGELLLKAALICADKQS